MTFYLQDLSVFYHLSNVLKLPETLLTVCWATIYYASSWKHYSRHPQNHYFHCLKTVLDRLIIVGPAPYLIHCNAAILQACT